MAAYDITSPTNDRIKRLKRLRSRRHREIEGVFIVEGLRLFNRALTAGLFPEEVFTDGTLDLDLAVTSVSPETLNKVSYRGVSESLMAVFPLLDTDIKRLHAIADGTVLILENVEKPGNLGAVMRTAAAAGVATVVTVGNTTDIHNPNVLRASTGALFDLTVVTGDWDSLASWASTNKFELVGATVSDGRSMWDTDLTGRRALVVGSEERGLTPLALSHVTCKVTIPQAKEKVDSLNVSVAAALLMFEARRQTLTC